MAKIKCDNPEQVVRRAFWLAWQACGGTAGMGFFQDRPGADEESVWKNVRSAGDYGRGGMITNPDKPGEAYGDYVFGRMMKLGLKWDADGVECRDDIPRIDYQEWCHKYPSFAVLVNAAIADLGKTKNS